MTLDEAIKHCKEKAKELREKAPYINDSEYANVSAKDECLECANEHEQLAGWLEDYKRLLGEKSYAMGYQDGVEDGLNDIRPKGKWVNQFIGGNECVMCSECKLHFDIGTNYCPNCGADMRGAK